MMHRDYCSPENLHLLLAGSETLFVLDFRSPDQYAADHVSGSINIQISLHDRRRIQKNVEYLATKIAEKGDRVESEVAEGLKEGVVVLYDQVSESLESLSAAPAGSSLPIVFKKLKESGAQVRLMKGGFQAFQEQYPGDCQGSQSKGTTSGQVSKEPITGLRNLHISSESKDVGSSTPYISSAYTNSPPHYDATGFPVQVLPFLYLGNAENAHDWQCLQEHGISHILNVTHNITNQFEGKIEYLQVPIQDKNSEDLFMHFEKAIGFVESAISREHGVLVHCLAGVSRSVTIVIAYLMKSQNISLDEAFDFVRRKRANIAPNFTFMGQLKDFEVALGLSPQQPCCTCATAPQVLCSQHSPSLAAASDGGSGTLPSERLTSGDDTLCPGPIGGGPTGAFTPSSGTSSSSSANETSSQKFSYQGFDKGSKFSL